MGRALKLEAKFGEEFNGGVEVLYHDAHVVHSLDRHDVSFCRQRIGSSAADEESVAYMHVGRALQGPNIQNLPEAAARQGFAQLRKRTLAMSEEGRVVMMIAIEEKGLRFRNEVEIG